jgi:hypothetical protein
MLLKVHSSNIIKTLLVVTKEAMVTLIIIINNTEVQVSEQLVSNLVLTPKT